ncbi:MAG: sensor of ECF-type sigma factor [Flavobacteriales bacterium]|mgnify:CR=1 FL=1|jgi:hypothetical protein|nr:sensor of ECF-type sigma factor [Ulvibacter sp.]|tara:strand:- start:701 stop:1135 length:435 start_codon:yes stop_codon:yes gene_type:complete
MKKIIIILFFASTGLIAQPDRFEKIRTLKTAYITQELSLTPSEAEKFWPVYNEYDSKRTKLRLSEGREVASKLRDVTEDLTDEEANILIDRWLQIESESLLLQQELISNLRKVLPPNKIIQLRKAENDFKRRLLKRYKGKDKKK